MKIKRINNNVILKYLTIGFVCLILSLSEIGGLKPFLFAFFFACLYVGVDEKIISGLTLTFGTLSNLTL